MQVSSYRIPGLLLALSLVVAPLAQAQEQEKSPWAGKVSLGAIATGGNSETSTLNAEFGLGYQRGIWQNNFTASAIQARAETTDTLGVKTKETTSERYAAALRSAFDFSEFNYLFAQIEYEKDLFGGIRERSTESVGYGRRLLKTPQQKLDVELGLGARQLLAQAIDAKRESEVIARAGLNYVLQMTETSRFSQKLSVESGDTNTYTESVSELKMSVIGGVFANLGFTWKNNSQVPAGSKNADTITSVSLSYEFGG